MNQAALGVLLLSLIGVSTFSFPTIRGKRTSQARGYDSDA
jgi:hypothetical protein